MNTILARGLACFLLTAAMLPATAAKGPAVGGSEKVTIEVGMDRMGGDYKGFALGQPDAKLCGQACTNDAACKAFTYVKPGIKGPDAMCFLKSSAPAASADACCTSGAKISLVPMIPVLLSVKPAPLLLANLPKIKTPEEFAADIAAKKAAEDKQKDESYEANQKFLQEGYEQASDEAQQAHHAQQCLLAQEEKKQAAAAAQAPYEAYAAARKVTKKAYDDFVAANNPFEGGICDSGGCDDAYMLRNYPSYQAVLDAYALELALLPAYEKASSLAGDKAFAAQQICK